MFFLGFFFGSGDSFIFGIDGGRGFFFSCYGFKGVGLGGGVLVGRFVFRLGKISESIV